MDIVKLEGSRIKTLHHRIGPTAASRGPQPRITWLSRGEPRSARWCLRLRDKASPAMGSRRDGCDSFFSTIFRSFSIPSFVSLWSCGLILIYAPSSNVTSSIQSFLELIFEPCPPWMRLVPSLSQFAVAPLFLPSSIFRNNAVRNL